MKKIQLLGLVIVIVALSGVARAANYIKPASITVFKVQGAARYSIDGKVWHPLVAGKILHEGAVIETAANSSCDLVLSGTPVPFARSVVTPGASSLSMVSAAPDPNIRGYVAFRPMAQQNVIRLDPDTMLAVDKLTVFNTGADTVSDTELDLRAGGVFTNVKKMNASSQYIIKLPNGVAGIRGSCGYIKLGVHGHQISPDVFWVSGTIVLSVPGPSGGPPIAIIVQGGFQYDAATGIVSNLSPAIAYILQQFKADAETIYAQLVAIAQDVTNIHVSPTQGVQGGGGNNNGGGDDDGGGP